MTKFQNIILIVFVLFVSINLYYEANYDSTKNFINPDPWEQFPTEEHWIKVNDVELRSYFTEARLFNKNNPFGITYNVRVEARSFKNSQIATVFLSKLKKKSYEDINSVSNAPFIDSLKPMRLENYLVVNEDWDFLHVSGGGAIQFYSPFFTPKKLQFVDDLGNTFYLKTNPLLVFESDLVKTILFFVALCLILIMFTYGHWEAFLLFFAFTFYFYSKSYFLWYFLVLLFLCSVIMKIKIKTIYYEGDLAFKIIGLKYGRLFLLFLLLIIWANFHNWNKSFEFFMFLYEIFASLLAVILILLGIHISTTIFYSLVLYFRFPEKSITEIQLTELKTSLDEKPFTIRKTLSYEANVTLNNSIQLYAASLSLDVYKRAKNNKPPKVSKYKTDGKGNYIIY